MSWVELDHWLYSLLSPTASHLAGERFKWAWLSSGVQKALGRGSGYSVSRVSQGVSRSTAVYFWKMVKMFRVFLALVTIAVYTSPSRVVERPGDYLSDDAGQARYTFVQPNSSSPHSSLSEIVSCYPHLRWLVRAMPFLVFPILTFAIWTFPISTFPI